MPATLDCSMSDPYSHVSRAPTRPRLPSTSEHFDVADLYRGPVATSAAADGAVAPDEKLRQAYFWIVNTAIICPYYDLEFNVVPPSPTPSAT
jgi:MoxR-like ATPase